MMVMNKDGKKTLVTLVSKPSATPAARDTTGESNETATESVEGIVIEC